MEKPEIKCIGTCEGCAQHGILRNGVCESCLHSPNRGERWARLAARIRKNPEIAMDVFKRLESKKGKKVFLFLFAHAMEEQGIDMDFIRAQVERAS